MHGSAVSAPEPEHLVARPGTAGGQEQDARQDRADLARDAVVEGEDLGPPLGRDDVVERAPGGVRQAALGDLLGEPDERRGGDREGHQPEAEPGEVDERQQERRAGDPEPRVDPVGEHDRDDERGGGHGRRQQAQAVASSASRMERLGRGEQERVRHREHEDREQDVGDRDEPHERRADDLVEAGAQVGDDRPVARDAAGRGRSSSARRRRRARPTTTSRIASSDDERRRADGARDRARTAASRRSCPRSPRPCRAGRAASPGGRRTRSRRSSRRS